MTSIVDHLHAVPADGLDADLARLLAEWMPRQRWYGGKGAHIAADGVSVLARLDLLPDRDPGLAVVVVEVRPEGRAPERYQLFLGARRQLPGTLEHVELGLLHGSDGVAWHCYDALHDPELAGWLLGRLAAGEVMGPLRFHLLPGHRINKGLRSLVLTGEQSNTSVIYGDKLIAKFLRRSVAGVNPDLELSLALADCGSRNIPQPVGWIDLTLDLDGGRGEQGGEGPAESEGGAKAAAPGAGEQGRAGQAGSAGRNANDAGVGSGRDAGRDEGPEGGRGGENGAGQSGQGRASAYSAYHGPEPITVATVSEFLPTATDGWLLAQTSVRDLYAQPAGTEPQAAGGDFAPEARRLGKATARVHHDLATSLPTGRLEPEDLERVADGMIRHLHAAAERVAELEPYVDALGEVLAALGSLDKPVQTQRVHGDFHLGQVMRTVDGWVLLDFEGEPSRTLAERRAMAPALKDVAGMARSFDYAAHHMGGEGPEGAARWAEHNFDAFCRGYAAVSGQDPREQMTLLRAYEIDKAVYEAVYEATNRPTWLSIPLGAIRRLTEGGESLPVVQAPEPGPA
jgi:maltokinase